MSAFTTIWDGKARTGESPVWDAGENCLWWVDIPAGALYRLKDGQIDSWVLGEDLGCVAPIATGGLLLALRSGLYRFESATGTKTLLAASLYDPSEQRFNDGKVGPDGRFWVGSIFEPRTGKHAKLYRFDKRGLIEVGGDVIVSNGLAWSPDGATLYHSDTRSHVIYRYDHKDGEIGPRSIFAEVPQEKGRPDGAAVDAEGFYWSAQFAGQRIIRFAPDGTIDREIETPVQRPTMCAFGGKDLDILYVTSATDGGEIKPLDGATLSFKPGVTGAPVPAFDPTK